MRDGKGGTSGTGRVVANPVLDRIGAAALDAGREYNARRLRTQRERIRDVMAEADLCDTWLTLAEIQHLTRFGAASISAQLRHLRKAENGGHQIIKRLREGSGARARGETERLEYAMEYRMIRDHALDRVTLRDARLLGDEVGTG